MHGAEIVEDVHAQWFAYLSNVPGLEVHYDSDVVWKVSEAAAWNNCGVRLRFSERSVDARLDHILARYRAHCRGAGFWVSPCARPSGIEQRLKARGLRCRKYYPAMFNDLQRELPRVQERVPVQLAVVDDYDVFRRDAHPAIGPATTKIRRFRLQAQQQLARSVPRKSWELLASVDGKPAGICTVFVGDRYAGLFDLAVAEHLRNRGIGRLLTRYACEFARDRGADGMILIATNLGYRIYGQAGFKEVARFGFWYTAHP